MHVRPQRPRRPQPGKGAALRNNNNDNSGKNYNNNHEVAAVAKFCRRRTVKGRRSNIRIYTYVCICTQIYGLCWLARLVVVHWRLRRPLTGLDRRSLCRSQGTLGVLCKYCQARHRAARAGDRAGPSIALPIDARRRCCERHVYTDARIPLVHPSHPIPSHPIPSRPVPSRPNPSHPSIQASNRLHAKLRGCGRDAV